MHVRTLFLPLLATAALAACAPDQALTGPDRAPATPLANHVGNTCVYFNVPPLGATFGAPAGNVPGTVVWVEQGIRVSVNKFVTLTGGSAYDRLRIEPMPASFTLAAGNTGHTLNLNAGFDFTGLTFAVTSVKFHFLHLGGYENLSVNGSPVFVGQLTAPPAALAGITVASAWAPVPGGSQGTITLTGSAANPIKRLLVGGQELWLDTVCAYP
ncbi:MAG TPA: hypothetical protein VFJ82_26050 [Longimicrobium sp.]|nr:hypothetical protein [Longimicrobium sp.]